MVPLRSDARGGIRTHTPRRTGPFEDPMSTDSITRATGESYEGFGGALRRLGLAAAGVRAVAVGFLAGDLDLRAPLLLEAAHRERRQEQLDRNEDQGEHPEDR